MHVVGDNLCLHKQVVPENTSHRFLSTPEFPIRRYHQDSFDQHGSRKQGAVPSGDPGQGHGRPDGRLVRDHHGEHHADGRQRQPAPLPPE